ncbi:MULTISPECIES: LpxL/LpxP family Kdo(2)-lipid IV(A) lauroyl/palmitoleoyl acyltransferase [unclassified Luteimonas]|uniref:LpxL/LpxP family Kdo(2)-lipid IV(A) lauroyl/palmitoleoyl acyltransferase n=1 Tax=unclassified Luteimonas TaxID=2629088 RepID=UPI0018F0CE68|nr:MULTISPECIES: LpxL/LpxP family Kdo(2)-lipid IV(A) lauroyl/palmitoleoyl acyltransferase [unclassified Luteimonas]MBJ6978846.1 LpxL/LpxP family Kdo(2)-lipid IV(A) lauroyl/palmitoleoyl acyltransferase [Luteimonas sp. MC1895]MBJ6984887.1 LpxL/LpxP family Kdo(2)-lipid IV(A) lauroyl/palmitoleoyl acyltransferase [Luteimonas sp. MC1750]QQO05571.1 LpxL/LpxP family Kdo(2)-lipid IV(A) lauroyl/palmitoleoyl acyltransferase [Luteimonas sp. MC1750]
MTTHADTPPLGLRNWPTWIGIGAMALLARLPWTLQRVLGRAIGVLLQRVLPARRRVAARNLELCFPELDAAAREALLREHFAAIGTGLFEFARAWWGSVAPLRRGLVVEGLEHMEAARAGGRGVIVVSGHFTTLEVCGRLMCDHVPLAGMYRPHAQPAMEWAVRRGRMRYAAAMFPKQDLRGTVRHLKRGGLLWYAPDQDPSRGESVYVPFFGRPANSLASTHQLARMSGAAVLFFQHARRADGGYTLRLFPAAEGFPSRDATADTAEVMAAIETMARAAPAQYLWIHRRFKRQPDGSSAY